MVSKGWLTSAASETSSSIWSSRARVLRGGAAGDVRAPELLEPAAEWLGSVDSSLVPSLPKKGLGAGTRRLPAGLGRTTLGEVRTSCGRPFTVFRPQDARSVMSVREPADPSTLQMGEAASSSAGHGEVDADVVQVDATLRIAPRGHRHLLFSSAWYFSWVRRDVPFESAVRSIQCKPLATSVMSPGVSLPAVDKVEIVTGELESSHMDRRPSRSDIFAENRECGSRELPRSPAG